MRLIFSLILLTAFLACKNGDSDHGEQSGAENTSNTTPSLAAYVTEDRDPICLMPKSDAMTDTAQYEGKIYGFCCDGCKGEFVDDPVKALSAQQK